MMETKLPDSVSINNSTPSFFVTAEPISDPIAEPTKPPTTAAISDSGSESVAFLPTAAPIAAQQQRQLLYHLQLLPLKLSLIHI